MTSDGHIGYQQLGRYPIRANPESGLFIKDGSTTDHDWRGFVPPGDRLQIIDPPSGYIVSANNRIASANYYNGLHAYNMFTARSDRLHQILSEGIAKGHKYTVEDAKKIVTDTVDVYCIQMQSYLKASIPQASSALEGFDCDFKPESTQATMYENFFYQLHHLAKPHNAEKMSIMSLHSNAQYLFNYIKDAVREQEKAEIVRSAWRKMKVALGEHFKNNDTSAWKWG
jgi:acyl-homoserine lactone acylase PvdQ